jgi:ABC-type microcin C transport system duplicated ATPase subunit YejF
LRLLLDEDSQARRLVELLRRRGHDVQTVGESNQAGAPDSVVLDMAADAGRVLLTRNCTDYLNLHEMRAAHSGILCVFQDPDPAKAMSYEDIARALMNLERSEVPLEGMFLALNAWRY